MRPVPVVALALAALMSTGCATILSDSKYDVAIDTNPSGREIRVIDRDGVPVYLGRTPALLTLRSGAGFFRTASYTIEVMDGSDVVQRRRLDAHLDGWYFGNLLFGWLIGFVIVDPATGAMWALDEDVLIRIEG